MKIPAYSLTLPLPAGRCSIFPDLSFVTFDGSHAALFKEAIYILSQSPNEMITVHVLDCKSANLVTAPCLPPCQDLGIGLGLEGRLGSELGFERCQR